MNEVIQSKYKENSFIKFDSRLDLNEYDYNITK